ncbi:MAG TPA: dethiobiotin synthase [Chroococcales cyanobacterium]
MNPNANRFHRIINIRRKSSLPRALFVTGTDTDIGKSFISAVLVSGLHAAYWKPVQSGLKPMTDTQWIKSVTKLPAERFFEEAYKLTEPLSPHAAANIDGVTIELEKINLPDHKRFDHLIVEGAGGLMVPLSRGTLMIDLISHLGLPAIVVARSGLGTINHTVLTVDKLRQKNIPVLGVVTNGPRNALNVNAIEEYAGVPVLAEVEPIASVDYRSLRETFERCFASVLQSAAHCYVVQQADLATASIAGER